jgi:micrococcal nuclease
MFRSFRDIDPGTQVFWSLIVVLLTLAAVYGVQAEAMRRGFQAADGKIASGDTVHLVKVIDGDTLLVGREGAKPVTIRMIGIRSTDDKVEKDVLSPFARMAKEEVQHLTEGQAMRVELDATPKDRRGRWLASLFVGPDDVALSLVKRGLALVQTAYPFPAMPLYLQQQGVARAARRGLWGNAAAAAHADAVLREAKDGPK